MPQVEDDVLQVANIAVYGLRRFWLLHWKVILVTVSITIVAGIIVAKIMRGNERFNKYNREAVTNKTPWGWQLLDLKSTNGTYLVRNREITPITEPTFLKENDIANKIYKILEITDVEDPAQLEGASKKIQRIITCKCKPIWTRI